MEFGFTEEQEKWRKEIHEYFMSELPEDYEPGNETMTEEKLSFWTGMQKKAGAKGYLTPGWPKEYGGMGLGSIEHGIHNEEVGYAGVRWPAWSGLNLAGPAVILFGTEEQKKKFIPPITRGEAVWNQAFTEPEAGSDEANVQLHAVEDGDDYILNGQKVFISILVKPDYLYTLTRTADVVPKHRGMSLFLIPADLPGITFRPLPTMGSGIQNEIFFDDVRVPKEYLLGELNRGFYHAMGVFEFERSGTGHPAGARRTLQEFVQLCKEEKRNGKPLIKDPQVREKIAQMAVEAELHRLTVWYGQWWFGQRERLGPKPYDLSGFFTKIFTTQHAEVMMNILGTYGQLRKGSKWTKFAGRIERLWQVARSLHAAGTIEIYKVVLAQRGLSLPRPPRPITAKADEKR
ncbi:acyl-CoA dehydrogenase family protein [Chloroflexota bacterium]